MNTTTPAQDLETLFEAFGRALTCKDRPHDVYVDALSGIATNLRSFDRLTTYDPDLRASFVRRMQGAVNLVPATPDFKEIRETLTLRAA